MLTGTKIGFTAELSPTLQTPLTERDHKTNLFNDNVLLKQ